MQKYEGAHTASGLRIGIVVSRWNEFITKQLLEGALDAIQRIGGDVNQVAVVNVPGSFEIPLAASALAQSGQIDTIVALGCIIRGDTSHYDHVAAAVTSGIQTVSLNYNIPVAFGLVTTENLEQAIDRAGCKSGNKGAEAAVTACEMANLLRILPSK